ncbi:MAG: hypothetical protein ACYS0E_10905 [Planctomycetota bacterium]|jgi:hypothetical protein
MLAAPKQPHLRSAPLIAGLVIVALAALALALPPAPIALQDGTGGVGALQAAGIFSDGMAEQNAADGYGYLALDLTRASDDRDAFWRQQLELVASRRYPVWGWIDIDRAAASVEQLVGSLQLAGVYVYGKGASKSADALRASRPGLTVIAVHRRGEGDASKDAIALDIDSYLNSSRDEFARPVLVADQLEAGEIREALDHAHSLAGEDGEPSLLIARVPLLR